MKPGSKLGRHKVEDDAQEGKASGKSQKGQWRKAIGDDASSTVSDISASTEGDGGDYMGSLDERSEDYQRFEKALRSKHSKACKAMSVRRHRELPSLITMCNNNIHRAPKNLTCCSFFPLSLLYLKIAMKCRMAHTKRLWLSSNQYYPICCHDTVKNTNAWVQPCTMWP